MKSLLIAFIVLSSTASLAKEKSKKNVVTTISEKVRLIDRSQIDEGRFSNVYTVEFTGKVDSDIKGDFIKAFAKIPHRSKVVLSLNSPGGVSIDFFSFDKTLEDLVKKYELSTLVSAGSTCASACLEIYLVGKKRMASPAAAFMIHGATPPPWVSNVPHIAKTEKYIDRLIDLGINKKWIERLRKIRVFSDPGAYWLSGEAAYREETGLVNELLPRHQKFKPYYNADTSRLPRI